MSTESNSRHAFLKDANIFTFLQQIYISEWAWYCMDTVTYAIKIKINLEITNNVIRCI